MIRMFSFIANRAKLFLALAPVLIVFILIFSIMENLRPTGSYAYLIALSIVMGAILLTVAGMQASWRLQIPTFLKVGILFWGLFFLVSPLYKTTPEFAVYLIYFGKIGTWITHGILYGAVFFGIGFLLGSPEEPKQKISEEV